MEPARLSPSVYPIADLDRNGFAQFRCLGPEAVAVLNGLCDSYLLPGEAAGFTSTSAILDLDESLVLNATIRKYLEPVMADLFPGLVLQGGTLAAKFPGRGYVEAHQDWTVVDESRFASYNLWIALTPTNPQNGTLGLIPGSHRWTNAVRGAGMENPWAVYTSRLARLGVEPCLEPGQAIIYDHRLLHFSRPNRSPVRRNVAIVGVNSAGASLRVAFRKEGRLLTYAADRNDFYRFDQKAVERHNRLLEERPYQPGHISWKRVKALYREHLPEGFQHPPPDWRSVLTELLHKLGR